MFSLSDGYTVIELSSYAKQRPKYFIVERSSKSTGYRTSSFCACFLTIRQTFTWDPTGPFVGEKKYIHWWLIMYIFQNHENLTKELNYKCWLSFRHKSMNCNLFRCVPIHWNLWNVDLSLCESDGYWEYPTSRNVVLISRRLWDLSHAEQMTAQYSSPCW